MLNSILSFTKFKKIRYQIAAGYILALGLSITGTITGQLVGNYFYHKSHQKSIEVDEISRELVNLSGNILHIQMDYENLINFLENPEIVILETNELMEHIELVHEEIEDLKKIRENNHLFKIEGLSYFLDHRVKIIENYLSEILNLVEKVESPKNVTEILQNQSIDLLELRKQKIYLEVHDIMNEIDELIQKADEQEDVAREYLEKAEVLRSLILLGSMLLSVIIATFVAIHIIQIISWPIQKITTAANQVTETSNFDLVMPGEGSDEVKILATSLNQLLGKVKQLIQEVKSEEESKTFQTEKMVTLGRMIAEVSHELNNPINSLYGNLAPLSDYIHHLVSLIDAYQSEFQSPSVAIQDKISAIELDFIREDLPQLIASMKVAAVRSKEIVQGLKNFSRIDEKQPHPVNLHECINSTLLILKNRTKNKVDIIQNYGEVPQIQGYAGLLSQVFMNIITNALDALEMRADQKTNQQISITTETVDDTWVVIRIKDNGVGIPLEIQSQIFESFFTTKPRGVGTGLGLAISHQIIVNKHQGEIACVSTQGEGTEFVIKVPVQLVTTNLIPTPVQSDR